MMRPMLRRELSVGALVATLAVACGGLTVAPGDGGASGDGPTGTLSGGGSSSGVAVDSSAGDGSRGSTDAAGLDAVVVDAITLVDAAAGKEASPTGPAVACPDETNPTTCQPGQFCCVVGNAKQGGQGSQTDTCEAAGAPCAGTPVHCAVPADCPSDQVCCGTEQTAGGVTSYVEVSCAWTCTAPTQRTFCDHLAGTPCPASAPTCALSTIMPGYDVCN